MKNEFEGLADGWYVCGRKRGYASIPYGYLHIVAGKCSRWIVAATAPDSLTAREKDALESLDGDRILQSFGRRLLTDLTPRTSYQFGTLQYSDLRPLFPTSVDEWAGELELL